MTAPAADVTLASLTERLDNLTDLFRRRLLDDRAKQATIEDLRTRLDRAERARDAESLRPLVIRIGDGHRATGVGSAY